MLAHKNQHRVLSPTAWVSAVAFLSIGLLSVTGCQRDPQARRDRSFQQGQKAAQEEKYYDAIIHFQNTVKADPDFVEGHYQLGRTSRKLGRLPQAARAFQRTLELAAEHTGAALELGEIYLMAKQPERARELAEGILSREEQSFRARILLAKSYMGEKNFSQAKVELEKAKGLEPDNAAVYLAIGIVEIGLGRFAAAEAPFKRALELDQARVEAYQNLAKLYLGLNRLAEAEQVLKKGTKNSSDNTKMHLALADFYYRTGRLEKTEYVLDSLKTHTTERDRLRVELGDFWVTHHQPARAVEEYRASLSVRSSTLAKKKLVSAYVTLGDAVAADRWNEQVLEQNPKDHEAKMFRGAIAYLRGERTRAIAELEAAIASDPQSIFAHYYLGSAYLADGKLGQAQAEFHDCIRLNEKFVHALIRLGELSLQKNDPASAAEYAQKVITLSPWRLDGHLLAAGAALLEKVTERAGRALQVAARLAPGNFLVHERWAQLYALRKNYSRAEREYQQALASNPKPEETLALMARYYVEHGRIGQGVAKFQRYLDSHGPTPRLHELLAQLYLAQGAWAKAAEACEKALALEPNRLVAQVYRGQALARLDRLEEAKNSYERAIEINPRQLAPYLHLADLHWLQANFSQAAQHYRRALVINPNSPAAQTGLARALADAGQDLDWALSLAQQAKQQHPEEPVISDALAWVYHKKGLNSLAVPLLQECVAKSKQNPLFQFHLGMVYLKNGRRGEGQRLLQAALKNGLTSPYAGGAQETLSSLGGL